MATKKQAQFLEYQKDVYDEFLFYLLTCKSPRKVTKSAFRLLQVYEIMAQSLIQLEQEKKVQFSDFATTYYSTRSKSEHLKATNP